MPIDHLDETIAKDIVGEDLDSDRITFVEITDAWTTCHASLVADMFNQWRRSRGRQT